MIRSYTLYNQKNPSTSSSKKPSIFEYKNLTLLGISDFKKLKEKKKNKINAYTNLLK